MFLKKYGPDLYQQWGQGQLPWTSPQVKDVFEQFGALLGNDRNVSGGVAGMLSAPIATGYNGLTAASPSCQVALWGSWTPALIGPTAKPGTNIDFYRVPATDRKYANDESFQATVSVAFNDNPTTKAFLRFMASTPAQTYLASLGRWPVANKNVPASAYPTPVLQKISAEYFGTTGVQFRAGPQVLASAAKIKAFRSGIVSYLQNPSQLDSILQTIQSAP